MVKFLLIYIVFSWFLSFFYTIYIKKCSYFQMSLHFYKYLQQFSKYVYAETTVLSWYLDKLVHNIEQSELVRQNSLDSWV